MKKNKVLNRDDVGYSDLIKQAVKELRTNGKAVVYSANQVYDVFQKCAFEFRMSCVNVKNKYEIEREKK